MQPGEEKSPERPGLCKYQAMALCTRCFAAGGGSGLGIDGEVALHPQVALFVAVHLDADFAADQGARVDRFAFLDSGSIADLCDDAKGAVCALFVLDTLAGLGIDGIRAVTDGDGRIVAGFQLLIGQVIHLLVTGQVQPIGHLATVLTPHDHLGLRRGILHGIMLHFGTGDGFDDDMVSSYFQQVAGVRTADQEEVFSRALLFTHRD